MGREGGPDQTPGSHFQGELSIQHMKTREVESNFSQDQHEGSWVTCSLAYSVSTLLGWKDSLQTTIF